MNKDDFARELIMEELKKEKGKFVTQRIIDRLVLLYAPLFDRQFLADIADLVNNEKGGSGPARWAAAVN